MNLKIELGTGIQETSRQKLLRQLSFKFASLDSSVVSLAASLEKEEKQQPGRTWYVCRMRARLANGGRHDVEQRSLHSSICIADAASRLAREVGRKSRVMDTLVAAG